MNYAQITNNTIKDTSKFFFQKIISYQSVVKSSRENRNIIYELTF